ncbi:DUF3515 domain-containing protein [Corynebacterium sp. sy039]|uniref:DUF3515 domain-containing protein n=1 Tax=Corynebacterium sp. sy039 TaxID=2599641 RepID=UPI0011B856DC|nr:DUF3515 domain-containing protein [Corynebacterium sp. sy039]QDZ43526.1 DUF3515 domain-containing protein [Corynebacterium sp. sy039]
MQNEHYKTIPIVIALVLAIALVIAVLVGARVVAHRAAHQPVAMPVIDSPEAESTECADFISALPDTFLGHRRATIADPVPAGVAAWQSSSTERITLRCGVNLPLQYSELSPLQNYGDTQWLRVADPTPQSSMQSWYSTNRSPVIAISADAPALNKEFNPAELKDALNKLSKNTVQPYPIALNNLVPAQLTDQQQQQCSAFLAALPPTLGTEPQYSAVPEAKLTQRAVNNMAAWVVDGYEPIVVRCGVEFPEKYQAGAQIQQVNNVAWFEDTSAENSTTASTWFAVDRSITVAVSVPQSSGNAALVSITQALDETIPVR